MQKIIAIEPGSLKSAYVVIVDDRPIASGVLPNEEMFEYLNQANGIDACIMELLPVAGVPFAEHIFRTNTWLGQFEAVAKSKGMIVSYVGKTEVALNICGKSDVTKKQIRKALIRRFATHDFNTAHGTRENPDILYSIRWEAFMALAYGVTWLDKKTMRSKK